MEMQPVILCFISSIKEELCTNCFKKFKIVYVAFLTIILYGNIYMTAVDQETTYEGRNSSETLIHEVVSELRTKQMIDYVRDRI